MKTILIDNGHGKDTPGKCSPDGSLREYKWTREVARLIVDELCRRGYDARLLVREDTDVPLPIRVRRVNEVCAQLGNGNVVLVSIHSNAAGNGQWMGARGWCAYTTPGKTASDALATCLYDAAARHLQGHSLRKDMTDGDPDWEANFYILAKTRCAAVLTENLFHDNRQDVAFMLTDEGKRAIAMLHADGVQAYIRATS